MSCIFCEIIRGDVPAIKITETENVLVFMDAFPISEGHMLFIPKVHAEKLHDTNDQALGEIPVLMKKIAKAAGVDSYNVLQNNGSIAHQAVKHVHFHLIPKPNKEQGLGIKWSPLNDIDQASFANNVKSRL